MEIDMNRDLERFKESIFMGLSLKQLLYSIMALAAGAAVVLIIYPYVGLTMAAYVAVPVVAPIALTGFYSYHGMTFMEKMKLKFHFMFHRRALTYLSTEGPEEIDRLLDEFEARERAIRKQQKKHKRKHQKKRKSEVTDHGHV